MHLFIHCIFTTIGCSILRLALGKPKALILLTLGCAQFGTPVELRSTIGGGVIMSSLCTRVEALAAELGEEREKGET
jgi:hypothetical protein